MTIGTQRLATDPGYWDGAGVPEGATHYFHPSGDWYKKTEDSVFAWWPSIESWHEAGSPERLNDERTIPRPQKPEVEVDRWKAGDIVQTGPVSLRYKVEWTNGDDVLISEIGRPYEVELTRWDLIMPARTQEQRQRDDLEDLIHSNLGPECNIEAAASAIIDAGWKKDV